MQQILQADIWLGVALILRSLIDASDEKNGLTTVPENVQEKPTDFGNVQLGSPQKSTLIGDPLGQSASSPLFEHFHTKLLKFLSNSGYGTSALNNQVYSFQGKFLIAYIIPCLDHRVPVSQIIL
jgi:hypothetical protein